MKVNSTVLSKQTSRSCPSVYRTPWILFHWSNVWLLNQVIVQFGSETLCTVYF